MALEGISTMDHLVNTPLEKSNIELSNPKGESFGFQVRPETHSLSGEDSEGQLDVENSESPSPVHISSETCNQKP